LGCSTASGVGSCFSGTARLHRSAGTRFGSRIFTTQFSALGGLSSRLGFFTLVIATGNKTESRHNKAGKSDLFHFLLFKYYGMFNCSGTKI
jgi:hypothetical protein